MLTTRPLKSLEVCDTEIKKHIRYSQRQHAGREIKNWYRITCADFQMFLGVRQL
jgi:hypothetical protein